MPFQTPLPVWGLAFLTRVRGWRLAGGRQYTGLLATWWRGYEGLSCAKLNIS